MKKTYINPTLEVVKINTGVQLLAGSTLSIGSGDKAPATEADARWYDDESFFDE